MRPLARKLLVASLTTALAGLLALFALERRGRVSSADLDLVDNTAEITALLSERATPPGGRVPDPADPASRGGTGAHSPDPSYPPPLIREPLTEEQASKFYGALRKRSQYHFQPQAHLWPGENQRGQRTLEEHAAGGWDFRTNDRGFRKDVDVLASPPDMRVLVVGDSHTAGLVPNSESYANVLEDLLREAHPHRTFEVLNAGVGGTHVYNYLGVLEYLRDELRPDVLVVGLYGGNDFQGLMALDRFYHRRPAPHSGPHGGKALRQLSPIGPVAQVLVQTAYFLDNPDDLPLAEVAVDSITMEIVRQCEEAGIAPIFLYIPPATSVQAERYDHLMEVPLATLDITREELGLTDELASHWLEFLAQRELSSVDMQPVFRAAEESCFWFTDLHINTHGHRLVAEALAPVVADLLR